MLPDRIACLVLACGNTLRGDDGVGPRLAEWAEERFRPDPAVRIVCRHLWTPELTEEIANADAVLFLDSSAGSPPGVVQLAAVEPAQSSAGIATHHVEPAQLLSLCQEFYACRPPRARILTVGLATTELGAGFSEAVQHALPQACALLEKTVHQLLAEAQRS